MSEDSPTVEDRPGRPADKQLAGLADYELGEVIGSGGMGEVAQARDIRIGRDVAIKRMRDAEPSDDKIDRFLREAKIQARLDHPAIVPVHEIGFDSSGRPYFVMKRLAGVTLEAVIREEKVSSQRMLHALVDVCNAIALAHARGIIHRDLKPSNIMLGDYGEVYVIDWGVAHVLGSDDEGSAIASIDPSGQTVTGQMLGTPGYMAPEQITGDHEVGPPTDVYALGAILFEILTSRRLHPSGSSALASTVESTDVSPQRRRPDRPIPPELEEACVAALHRDPRKRPSVVELRDAIQKHLDGDRDLERRRQQALELARLAGSAERHEAIQLAGRALAFDPTCEPAVALLARMLLEPPREIPPEVRAEMAQDEAAATRQRSRRAIAPYAITIALVLALALQGVADVPMLAVVGVTLGMLVATSYINWRVRLLPAWWFALVQLFALTSFAQICGPFVVMPALTVGMLISLSSRPGFIDRAWLVIAWAAVVTLLPEILESLGVFDRTFWFTDDGLLIRGAVFPQSSLGRAVLLSANTAGVVLVAMFALGVARDRRDAKQRTFVQAWQLQQLVPR